MTFIRTYMITYVHVRMLMRTNMICMLMRTYVICMLMHTYSTRYVRYFSQKTGRRTAVNLCTYGDRPGIDRCTYGVRTDVVCAYAVFFSLADAFAIGLWLLSFRLKTKFVTLRS